MTSNVYIHRYIHIYIYIYLYKSLQQSYETKECFKDIKLIKSQRQPSSLKKILTRAIYSNKIKKALQQKVH